MTNRKPRTEAQIYAWHNAKLAHIAAHGEKDRGGPPICEGDPHPGWYMRRLVSKGPYVPARIWIENPPLDENGDMTGPEKLLCEVDGKSRDPFREWTWLAGRPITEEAYMDMLSGAFRHVGTFETPTQDDRPEAPLAAYDDAAPAEPAAQAPPSNGKTDF